jgi:dTDP-4-dehydrorhamnose reductase
MKILLIGASGQLGTDLSQVLRRRGDTVIPVAHPEADIRDSGRLNTVIVDARPDLVISTAAFHKVEECEMKPLVAFDVNAVGAINLAKECQRMGCGLVYFSTDYVFSGAQRRPYSESDLPQPLSVYGASKLAGEHLIVWGCERHFIVRTCGLYGLAGSSGKGGNFIENMLKKAVTAEPIRVVDDQVLTPSYTVDVAEAVAKLVSTERYGTYHISNEGECSWYKFTKEAFGLEGLSADLIPVATDQFPSPVKRPAYSVLSKQKLTGIQIEMPQWQNALARYLAARKEALSQGHLCPG